MSASYALLVPVKSLTSAKSRLVVDAPLDRVPLMRAFAHDVVAAARRSRLVGHVHVVTDDDTLGADLEAPAGSDGAAVSLLRDAGAGDLNAALAHAAHGVRLRDPATGVAALLADLPSLLPADLDTALGAGLTPRWYVADAAGTGTTLLVARAGTDLDPHFGADSAARHERSGAVPVRAPVATLRRDVDTREDLAAALALGVGPHSRAVLDPSP